MFVTDNWRLATGDWRANFPENRSRSSGGDILISSFQLQSRFVQVLFEPDSKASDSLSYDLTAWALPYAYNLKAYALTEPTKPEAISVIYLTENLFQDLQVISSRIR